MESFICASPNWKQPKYRSTAKWIKKLCHTQTINTIQDICNNTQESQNYAGWKVTKWTMHYIIPFILWNANEFIVTEHGSVVAWWQGEIESDIKMGTRKLWGVVICYYLDYDGFMVDTYVKACQIAQPIFLRWNRFLINSGRERLQNFKVGEQITKKKRDRFDYRKSWIFHMS